MSKSDTYKELIHSQIPALQLLINLGWQYLTPAEALNLREGREKNVVLTGILDPWLREHNAINYKGTLHAFSDSNIRDAITKLTDEPLQSLIPTSETIYELLTLGTSLTQTIDGDRKSYSLHYIDWQQPENNVYHVTEEFSVEKQGSQEHRRPDLVLFVNGIPLAVVECKRADKDYQGEKSTAEAVSQMIRNQKMDEIPHLFIYSQLLLAVNPNEALYATTGTGKKFWSIWREETQIQPEVHKRINTPLSESIKAHLYDWRPEAFNVRRHFEQLGERIPSAQDMTLYALLRPQRLLEIAYQFLVYDDGTKKIARYQQYFAIRATLNRVTHLNAQGTRTGGVIWHTTGSGKSLTMVMLAKALALHPSVQYPRIILVTDRVNLDDQIYGTFKACGKSVVQAESGQQLVRLVTGKLKSGETRGDVITTVINKFDEAARQKIHEDSENIFVLVDESHRSQYGSMHAKMQQVFPNACYIGFTGTPLTKAEKSTAKRFGDFIHKYPMRQAVEDKAVVPLLYEGRIVEQDVDKHQLEKWFERHTKDLNDDEKADLKRKMSRSEAVNATDQRIHEIAYDIADHYKANFRGSGLKAQVATASKAIGLKYLGYLVENDIDAVLVISPPDSREGHEEVDSPTAEPVQAFWKQMMGKYRSEDDYHREILSSFGRSGGIEVMVVVDKLLTGFDEPRNAVLYIDKSLKEHTLLQAIARVNRLFEGKEFGYIIDYRGVLGELNQAMDLYDALAEYDVDDIQGTISDVSEQIRRLPGIHSDLWAIFDPVDNKRDTEAMERFLGPEDKRQHFYETLTEYAKVLQVALATATFYEETPEKRINTYKDDLRFFHRLRQAVKLRYAEAVDYRDYEDKIRDLMNQHIRALGVETLTEMVDIFDVEKFDAEVARLHSPTAKADTILNRMKRSITERIDEDPTFYRRFSELVEETIEAYREGRIDEIEYLKQALSHQESFRSGKLGNEPEILDRYQHARAYYGLLKDTLAEQGVNDQESAEIAVRVEEIIEEHKITDWSSNEDVRKQISSRIGQFFFSLREYNIRFSPDELETIIAQVIETARARDRV